MFWSIVRQYYKGTAETHSVEVKADKDAALQRYFNIIAADLADATITYNACYIIDSNGVMIEGRVFDRRQTAETEETT